MKNSFPFPILNFQFAIFHVALAFTSAASADPAATLVSDEELAFIGKGSERIEMVPGTPESDAKRFYSSTSRNEYVEFNYDESKAGELGVDYSLENPLTFSDEWPAPYCDSAARPPFGYVRRTECHGLSPYDWKWAVDFANKALGVRAPALAR